jgi:hypothetical protein
MRTKDLSSKMRGGSVEEIERLEDESEQADQDRRTKRRIKKIMKRREAKPVGAAYGSSPNLKTHGL